MKIITEEDLIDSPPAYEEIYPEKRGDDIFSKHQLSMEIEYLLEIR